MIILLDFDGAFRAGDRQWLIDLMRGEYVIALSGQSPHVGEKLLKDMAASVGWKPAEAHFSGTGIGITEARMTALEGAIWPSHGREADYIGIETNSEALLLYHQLGIAAAPPAAFEGYANLAEAVSHICIAEAQDATPEPATRILKSRVSATHPRLSDGRAAGRRPVGD